jgi:hypothetical protein
MNVTLLCATGALSVSAAFTGSIGANPEGPSFHYKPAVLQSSVFLAIQHGFRFATEPGSRAELKGPFFRDWGRSIKGLSGWGDGDPFIVNYVGHPMMGAVTGYIAVQNDYRGRTAQFGRSGDYWKSRLRAAAWSAAYSTQFELGPVSEVSLGNVGKVPGTLGMVDLVVTPTAGFGLMVLEDAVDRYVIARLENVTGNLAWRIVVRSLLNPDRAMANLVRGKPPWHRDFRPGISER